MENSATKLPDGRTAAGRVPAKLADQPLKLHQPLSCRPPSDRKLVSPEEGLSGRPASRRCLFVELVRRY
ncbi:unnamed protein product [Nippostrongylus brasiliensis]|uniref:Uncharacterized protein n=1 Tax=Nippostrongylus brasiliensis TaxID=27835 RepID=A0A0N4YV77_NIPBR|nr:unnamed protein product [Nippostrongylus brasiliensis]